MQNLLDDLTSGDDLRAENSISAIVEMGAAAIPALLELVNSTEVDVRWWAVRALAASHHTRTEDLLRHLSDPAPEVRAAAALAVCEHPHECAVEVLIKTLADADPITAGVAGNALTKIGGPSVPGLLTVMKDAPASIRIIALRSLAEIRDHRAIPVMMKSMNEESAALQYWAKQGLEWLGLDMVYIKP
ncbi:MAG: HEAT repeat domain-containing protein [Anaerolineales bacterium]|nr:HEAT repeat domain-containing protein [Anaerolineales bacterium]